MNSLKSKLEKIAWITFSWVVISILQFLTGYTTLINLKMDMTGINPIDFLIGGVITGISAGLIGGSMMIFFWEKWLRTRSYRNSLLSILWSFTLVYFIVAFISRVSFYSGQYNAVLFDKEVMNSTWSDLFGITQIHSYFFWLIIIVITLIALLVNDKYGPGVFKSFLLGKYFEPKREERIFMFLDLRGSTSIAEKLGEKKYFNFIRDVFKDATPSILKSFGEIYQYVGDEIVISWKKEIGIKNANCLMCFLDIQENLLDKSNYYLEVYGIQPEFKAGLHYGHVMVGEVGIVKREIAFSGDVLNTAARIQSKCNDYNVDILLSKYLLDSFNKLPTKVIPKSIGEIKLRGKEHQITLFTI